MKKEMKNKMMHAKEEGVKMMQDTKNVKMMEVDGKKWKYVMSDGMIVLENEAVIMKHGDAMYKMHGDDMFMMNKDGKIMKNGIEMKKEDQDMEKIKNCIMKAKEIMPK